MNGIIPLYKPRGITSFGCVSRIRRLLHVKKVGHSGTLDPDVDGVLPICVGNATKVVSYLMKRGKVYQGTVTLGFSTETEDLSGRVIRRFPVTSPVKLQTVKGGMRDLTSPHLIQVPPMYSAVRVNGRHLYQYARAGKTVKRPARTVRVDYFKLLRLPRYDKLHHLEIIPFEIGCGKGTYVRTLAVSLGKKLGFPAVMSNLTRVQSGGFKLKQAVSFAQIKHDLQAQQIRSFLYPVDYALGSVPVHSMSVSQWHRVQNGAFLYPEDLSKSVRSVILKYHQQTKALYGWDAHWHCYRPVTMFSTK